MTIRYCRGSGTVNWAGFVQSEVKIYLLQSYLSYLSGIQSNGLFRPQLPRSGQGKEYNIMRESKVHCNIHEACHCSEEKDV